jgi:type II secretory pathway pseudopilin PulG
MAVEGEGANASAVPLDENGFIPGTTYKTVDDLIKGHSELKGLSDKQGNELGTLRKEHDGLKSQTELLANVLKENLQGGKKVVEPGPAPVDYAAELSSIETQIQGLDPMSPTYQKDLSSLVTKSNRLTAADQHQKTLGAAGKMMKDELSARDAKAAQEEFRRENPTFDTPEMQTRIKEYIAKDKTGMHDALSAFFQIQRDDIAASATQLQTENAEYKRLIDLNKGKDDAGKVVVKPSNAGPVGKPTKVTGKDLDAGMRAVLQTQK